MRIILTGSPCSGKTTLAKKLSEKLHYKLLHISNFIKEKKISSGYDRMKKARIVDVGKLKAKLIEQYGEAKNMIFEGHLLCEFPFKADYVFVIRAHPDMLVKRMKKRGYDERKIQENVLAELLDYFSIKAKMNYRKAKIFEINSGARSVNKNIELIVNIIKGKRKRADRVDWSAELLDRALAGLR
ncbi:MAG: adenylate kinase family protein [Candidatus Anstonellales archaeon]